MFWSRKSKSNKAKVAPGVEPTPAPRAVESNSPPAAGEPERPKEIGGRKEGLDPTRYGDWEKNGRAIDF